MQGEQSVLLLVYAVTVLVAVLTSARAQRTVLSTACSSSRQASPWARAASG